MDTMWEKIKKGLKDGATLSMEKIDQYTKIGKLKIEEMAANRKIDRNYLDIGERVVDLMEESKGAQIEKDLTIEKAIKNIKALRQELVIIAEKIEQISEEARKAHPRGPSDEEEEIPSV